MTIALLFSQKNRKQTWHETVPVSFYPIKGKVLPNGVKIALTRWKYPKSKM